MQGIGFSPPGGIPAATGGHPGRGKVIVSAWDGGRIVPSDDLVNAWNAYEAAIPAGKTVFANLATEDDPPVCKGDWIIAAVSP